MRKVQILNSLGKNLAAVVHYPETKTDRPARFAGASARQAGEAGKLAILCPGYLDTKDYAHLVELANTLAEKGYTAVRFDPTGTWESEGDISEYTTTQYLSDIKSVLEYMLRESKYLHILLGGHSRGGMVSILYAAKDPRISEVVGIMASSPLSLMGKRRENWEKLGFDISQRDLPNKIGEKEFRVPFSHVTDREKYNVLEEVKNVHIPILLIAGELDTLVLPEHLKLIYDAANEPKKFIVLPKIGHDYRLNPAEIKIVNEEILRNLK